MIRFSNSKKRCQKPTNKCVVDMLPPVREFDTFFILFLFLWLCSLCTTIIIMINVVYTNLALAALLFNQSYVTAFAMETSSPAKKLKSSGYLSEIPEGPPDVCSVMFYVHLLCWHAVYITQSSLHFIIL